MRTLAAVALSLVALSAMAQNVTDNVDRFTGKRKIQYSNSVQPPLGQPKVGYAHTTLESGKPLTAITFTLGNVSNRNGSSWKYLSCHNVAWLVDGKPTSMGMAVHTGTVVRGGVIETISQEVPTEAVIAISNAQRVEYRICNDERALSAEDIAAFRILAQKLGIADPSVPQASRTSSSPPSSPAASPQDASNHPSASAAKRALGQYQCSTEFRIVGNYAGKTLFEAQCSAGGTQLVECRELSCKALR